MYKICGFPGLLYIKFYGLLLFKVKLGKVCGSVGIICISLLNVYENRGFPKELNKAEALEERKSDEIRTRKVFSSLSFSQPILGKRRQQGAIGN